LNSNVTAGLTVAVLAVALIIGGIGAGIAISGREGSPATTTLTTTATGTSTNSSSPFVLTLVVTINNLFNSSAGDMPAYYVLGPSGLQSSASISVPAHKLIKLVIINYDDGNASMVQPGVNVVSGTQNNTVQVASDNYVNSTEGLSGIDIRSTPSQTISSVDPMDLAHTFSVQGLGLNIPLPTSSVVVAYFTIEQAGTYTWQCMTLCGGAAMSSPGWMTGSLVAS
jgi:hypothetical protein